MTDTEKKQIIVEPMQMGFIAYWEKTVFRETGMGDTERQAEEQAHAALYATINSLAVDDQSALSALTGSNNELADKLKKPLLIAAQRKTLPKVGNKFAVALEISEADARKLLETLTGRPMGKHAVGVTSTLPEGVMGRIEESRRQFSERGTSPR